MEKCNGEWQFLVDGKENIPVSERLVASGNYWLASNTDDQVGGGGKKHLQFTASSAGAIPVLPRPVVSTGGGHASPYDSLSPPQLLRLSHSLTLLEKVQIVS